MKTTPITFLTFICCTAPGMGSAQHLFNYPATVRSIDGATEVSGSVPAVSPRPGERSPAFIDPANGAYVPALNASIDAQLPPGNAISRVEFFAKRTGTPDWQPCTPRDVEGPQYQACLTAPLPPDTGRVCIKSRRYFCGDMTDIEFKLGGGNFSCHNLGPEFRSVTLFLEHMSRSSGFDFLAKIVHQPCGPVGPNPAFRTN